MNFVANLDTSRFDLQLACLKRRGEFLSEIEARQIPLEEYRVDRLYGAKALKQQLRFARHLRRNRTQVVHTYGFYPNVFAIAAARLAGTPVVVASIRDNGVHLTPFQKRAQRLVCRMADIILVNAEAIQRTLILEGYQPDKIRVIRNGVALSAFGGKPNGTRLRQELGVPPSAPVVMMLSRLDQFKGIGDFLEAAAMVAARVPEVRFVVVGDGPAMRQAAGTARVRVLA